MPKCELRGNVKKKPAESNLKLTSVPYWMIINSRSVRALEIGEKCTDTKAGSAGPAI